MIVGMDDLTLAAGNAAALWTRIGRARGYSLERGDGFLAVIGDEQLGLRVLTLCAQLSAADRAALAALAVRPGRVVVEDAFGAADLAPLGLASRHLPVMIRRAAPVPAPRIPVRRVHAPADLRIAERIVVDGFALEDFQPYTPGVVFPDEVLADLELYLTDLDGAPAGACVVVPEAAAVGVYWVTTMPAFRSRGVGRALMHEVLGRFDDRPTTLTSSRAGRPLYESLGFEHLADATWWTPAAA
jgi:GNAT superfamily N-acetyltransferase